MRDYLANAINFRECAMVGIDRVDQDELLGIPCSLNLGDAIDAALGSVLELHGIKFNEKDGILHKFELVNALQLGVNFPENSERALRKAEEWLTDYRNDNFVAFGFRLREVLEVLDRLIEHSMSCVQEVSLTPLETFKEDQIATPVYDKSLVKYEDKRYNFLTVVDSDYKGLCHVHPMAQKGIKDFCDVLRQDERVEGIVLFGSAITTRFSKESDYDIVVIAPSVTDYKQRGEILRPTYKVWDRERDIFFLNQIQKDGNILNAAKRGVKIY